RPWRAREAPGATRRELAGLVRCVHGGGAGGREATRVSFHQPINTVNLERSTRMSTIHLHQTTTLTPQQYVAGLTDFGPGRSKIFSNSTDDYLKVHEKSGSQADVTEGSGGIWERLHYDWSDPNRVVLKTTDSNLWGGASGHTYTF